MRKLLTILFIFAILFTGLDCKAATYPEYRPDAPIPERPHLTKSNGVFYGVSGKETYYNLNMSKVVAEMRRLGYDEATYPYYIREDGAKCLGDYVICAANYNIRPKGTILETSLGYAIVCDTGTFASHNSTQIDLATDW